MTHRKQLYGYQIQYGKITIQPQEAETVRRVFSAYCNGESYQRIAEWLNQNHIPFSEDNPLWDKHRVKRMLENEKYRGLGAYPPIVSENIFQAVQHQITKKQRPLVREKETDQIPWDKLRCGKCGGTLNHIGGKRNRNIAYLKCKDCGICISQSITSLLEAISQQRPNSTSPEYGPSTQVIQIENAINRGIEQFDDLDAVIHLILQGISARYACFVEQDISAKLEISYILISAHNEITICFDK